MPVANAKAFNSPRRRLARAKNHIDRFEKRADKFFGKGPYKTFIKMDADGTTELFGVKLAKPIPESLVDAATEALEALRSVLDQAGYSTATASGKVAPKSAYFPFADTTDQLENVIKGRCKDIPPEITKLFRSFKPYKGGNDAIWALNKLRQATHTTLIPIGVFTGTASVSATHASGRPQIIAQLWSAGRRARPHQTRAAPHQRGDTLDAPSGAPPPRPGRGTCDGRNPAPRATGRRSYGR